MYLYNILVNNFIFAQTSGENINSVQCPYLNISYGYAIEAIK